MGKLHGSKTSLQAVFPLKSTTDLALQSLSLKGRVNFSRKKKQCTVNTAQAVLGKKMMLKSRNNGGTIKHLILEFSSPL